MFGAIQNGLMRAKDRLPRLTDLDLPRFLELLRERDDW